MLSPKFALLSVLTSAFVLLMTRQRSTPASSARAPIAPPKPKPTAKAPTPASSKKWRRIGSPATLRPGSSYAGVIELSGLETLASDSMVADKLREIGPWTALRVWSDPADTPIDFPGTKADASGRRWALGTFGGSQSKTAALPEQLRELWEG